MSPMAWIVSVDVGGTFTDAIAFDPASRLLRRAKAYSTTPDVVDGVAAAIERLDLGSSDIAHVLNGTTVVTNTLLTRSGARTALVTTAGFEDALETGRERRVGGGLSMYDLRQAGPAPLVERFLRFPVHERMAADGQVMSPLPEAEVRKLARRFRDLDIEAVAICFLFSFINPAHEQQAARILREECPGLRVELSSDVAPEIREYERASTCTINAYTWASFEAYVSGLHRALHASRRSPTVYVMQSSGGLVPATSDSLRPVQILESGPSAGLVGASWIGRESNLDNIIALDVGGTTAKAGLLRNGEYGIVREFKADTYYPVRVPSLDLAEIGIGGGSIARIDSGGSLRVGPESAGASPGPVCYGRGGKQVTVTDAAAILGRVRPNGFLGGSIPLDLEAARQAIVERIGSPLSLDPARAAAGIFRIAVSQTASVVQLISTKRGVDPRDFAIVAYGGAGPLLACEVAGELGVEKVIVPVGAATFSAFGMMVADRKGDASATLMSGDPVADADEVEARFCELEAIAARRIGLGREAALLRRTIYARYVGQRWELPVPIGTAKFSAETWAEAIGSFQAEHEKAYAFHSDDMAVEMVQLHVEAAAPLQRPDRLAFEDSAAASAPAAGHQVWDGYNYAPCAVFTRADFAGGATRRGPALIEDPDTTIWVPPGAIASVDRNHDLVIDLQARNAAQ